MYKSYTIELSSLNCISQSSINSKLGVSFIGLTVSKNSLLEELD